MSFVEYEKEILIINNYINMNRHSHALDRLTNILREQPTDAYLNYLYAFCLYKMDRCDEAIYSCKSAMDNGYRMDECYYLLSRIHTQKDKYAEAESLLVSALEIDSQNADYIAFYGYLMMLMGKDSRALEFINHALEIDPENLSALHYKFYYYLDMDDSYGIRSKVIEKYFSLSTDECDRFLKAGMLDYYRYDYDGAEKNFRQAFQLVPTDKFIFNLLERINRKPRFFFRLKRLIRTWIMRKLAVTRAVLKAKWILFKCVGFTRDTMIFAAAPAVLVLFVIIILIIIF